MEQPENSGLFDFQIDQNSINYLAETARWTRFLSILGFIFCGLMAIMAIFLGSFFAQMMSATYETAGRYGGIFFTIIYLLIALLLFFPTLYLYNFSNKMRKAVRTNDSSFMTESFKNLKSYFKFHGILAIIIIAIYALALVAAILGALLGHRA